MSNIKKTYRVLYDFEAVEDKEISVHKNDLVYGMSGEEKGWILIKLVSNPKVEGIVPFSYLKRSPAIARPPTTTVTKNKSEAEISIPVIKHGENSAIEHAECSICFNPMISKKSIVALYKSNGKRACRHYLHKTCIEMIINEKKIMQCAVCQAPFVSIKEVPSFEQNPEEFFEVVDYDGNKKLNKGEVILILKSLVDVDYHEIEKNVEQFWDRWDINGNGYLTFSEMMHPKNGLLQYLRSTYPVKSGEISYPKLTSSTKKQFFKFWDENHSNTLCLDEIVRAVMHTYHQGEVGKAFEIRDTLQSLWPLFDEDQNGVIDEEEFCKANGLGDSLLSSYQL